MVKNDADLKVFQSNNLTLATHNMNALQKNIVYRILVYCKDDLKQERNTNLYGEKNIIYFKKAELIKHKGDLGKLDRDLKDLRERSIILKMPDGTKIITGVVLRSVVKPHQDVGILLCSYFIEFARHCYKEFTAYNFQVAFNFKGVHTKRIYEICCMAKNLGKYKLLLVRFREILGIENKYRDSYLLKNKVLKPAQKRINECEAAEISFDYEFEKKNREVFVVLKIKDKKKQAEKRKLMQSWGKETPVPKMNQACSILNELFSEKHRFYEIFEDLKKAGQIPDFIMKHHQKRQYYEKIGIKETEFKKIMTYILKNDFGIDLKNYRQEGVGIKNRPKPKTLKGQINFLRK